MNAALVAAKAVKNGIPKATPHYTQVDEIYTYVNNAKATKA